MRYSLNTKPKAPEQLIYNIMKTGDENRTCDPQEQQNEALKYLKVYKIQRKTSCY